MQGTYEKLIEIMQNMGYVFWENIEEDFVISDYIGDSFSFIQFILEIEEEIEIELSDDFLSYELLQSARGFANKLDIYKKETN